MGRWPQERLALRDRSGAIVTDVMISPAFRLGELEAAFLDVGVRVTRERGVAPVAVTDRRPPGEADPQVVSLGSRTYVALVFASITVPFVPVAVAAAVGLPDTVLGALLLAAFVGVAVAWVVLLMGPKTLTLGPAEVHVGAGRRLPAGIPRGEVVALGVAAHPLGTLVRIHLRDGQTVDHRLVGVRPSRVRDAAHGAGVALR